MFGSLPLFSALRLGRLAGGGIRREMATFPRLCNPWRAATVYKGQKLLIAHLHSRLSKCAKLSKKLDSKRSLIMQDYERLQN